VAALKDQHMGSTISRWFKERQIGQQGDSTTMGEAGEMLSKLLDQHEGEERRQLLEGEIKDLVSNCLWRSRRFVGVQVS